eukprot:CAMPEP_0195534840 /NCGR_PEP_ID=MMETSP0794_2-20130614/43149_1 /TAXON_ID=515487 /ORGANISM="Stephanopyxis turris, Strain CCMP 815" /LENGTH=90 /DNA_ID=CAMNT_0040667807 /DNA_START=17 /DNA_END=289 /DNA_ORIENTATION=-
MARPNTSSRNADHTEQTPSSENADDRKRLSQLMDEEDHKICTQANKDSLLNDSLDRLRALTKDIEEDDWKYSGSALNDGVGGHIYSSLRK